MSDPTTQMPTHWKRNTVLFLSGQSISMFGSMIVQYAVMWWVTFETRSGIAVALYAVAAFLPQGLISVFGGVLADRMNRKVLVIVSDGTIAAVTLGLAVLMHNGVIDLWIILLAVGARSLGSGVQMPAAAAMIPQLVPEEHLMRINGLFQTAQSAMMLLAPAVAGAVFGAFGIVPVFFIDVVTAVIGIGFLLLIPVPTLAAVLGKKSSYRTDLVEGMRYIRGHRIVRWLLLLFAVIFTLSVAPSFVAPLLIARTFGPEVWMVTVLEILFSTGMILGGVLVSTILAKRSRITLMLVAMFGFGVATTAMGLSPTLAVFYVFMFAFGLLFPLFNAPFMTLIQETVEPEKQGRVFSYVGIVMALATPIGMMAFGPLADVISVQSLFICAGIATVLVMVIAMALPSGRAAMAAGRATDPGARDTAGEPEADPELESDGTAR